MKQMTIIDCKPIELKQFRNDFQSLLDLNKYMVTIEAKETGIVDYVNGHPWRKCKIEDS